MARLYIQMARNGLDGFLDKLKEGDLLYKKDNENNLLYYLIQMDKDLTLKKFLNFDLKKNSKIFTELKILGVNEGLLDLSYDKFDCSEIIRKIHNDEYDDGIKSQVEDLLEELKSLFEKDGKSDMDIVNALITSYRYSASINPLFVEEIKTMIKIKQENPDFNYTKKADGGYFTPKAGVVVENTSISTLNHETGHAIHYFITNFEIPENYQNLITSINNSPEWNDVIARYSQEFQTILQKAREKAQKIVEQYINDDSLSNEEQNVIEMLNTEKEKLIAKYLERDYSRETLDIILADSFTKEEFLRQKKDIEIEEVTDLILREEYDAFIAIGDIIDAIADGKFRGNLLHDSSGKDIPSAFGHGVKYYYRGDPTESLKIRFTEMVANYSSIIKSKKANEIMKTLKSIVGEDLVTMLDEFYKKRMINFQEYEYESGRSR